MVLPIRPPRGEAENEPQPHHPARRGQPVRRRAHPARLRAEQHHERAGGRSRREGGARLSLRGRRLRRAGPGRRAGGGPARSEAAQDRRPRGAAPLARRRAHAPPARGRADLEQRGEGRRLQLQPRRQQLRAQARGLHAVHPSGQAARPLLAGPQRAASARLGSRAPALRAGWCCKVFPTYPLRSTSVGCLRGEMATMSARKGGRHGGRAGSRKTAAASNARAKPARRPHTQSNAVNPPGAAASAGAPARGLFAGGGEMGALMRATDWSKTKLGPVEAWPRSLRTMLGVVLGSRFPMLLWWGPDLLHLYNDAYRPILRDKHPASLAAPAGEVWAEIWDVAGPMARSVQEGGPATWTEDLQLFISSGGMAEETYFTFSYSHVPGDDGAIGGLLNTVQETTAKVQSERQIRMLHDLAARAAEAKSEQEAYRIAAEVLSDYELDLPFVLLYVLNEEADDAQLVAVSGWKEYEGRAKPARVPVKEDASQVSWPFAEVIRTARELVIDDLSSRFGALP